MSKVKRPGDETPRGLQETIVEKSDAMAREYSAGREIRLREERVRRLSLEPQERRPQAVLPGRPVRPAAPRREREAGGAPTEPRRERLSQIPAPRREAAGHRAEPLPRSEPLPPAVTPSPAEGPPPRDLLAMELEELLRELRHGWRNLGWGDRVTLFSSVALIAGVFMPWVTDPAHTLQPGLFVGGLPHLAFALFACVLVVKGTPGAFGGIGGASPRERAHRYRRASLWLVLSGAASTLLGAYLMLVFGLQKAPDWPVELHFGLYWTLAAGTGLSYGGYVRFSRRAP